jgi:hypothetical protein
MICDLMEGEELTGSADDLLTALAGELLVQLASESSEAAQRRGAKVVGKDDVQFAADSVIASEEVRAKAVHVPFKEHEKRCEALRRFRESEDR